MRMNKLGLIIMFVGVALSMTFHFIGSFVFYSGAFGYMLHYGTVQIMPFFMMCGGLVLIVGLVIAFIVGKMLEGRYWAGISIAYQMVATSSIYLIFSQAYPNRILSPFLPHILLSNSTLCIAWFIGYYIKKRSPKRPNEREYPV